MVVPGGIESPDGGAAAAVAGEGAAAEAAVAGAGFAAGAAEAAAGEVCAAVMPAPIAITMATAAEIAIAWRINRSDSSEVETGTISSPNHARAVIRKRRTGFRSEP